MTPDPARSPLSAPLSKGADEPLYRQLYARLRRRILSGEFGVGGAIPPESSLMREYRVSRITVRAALEQLVRDGFLDRQRGRGSFVRSEVPETRSCLSSFTEQMLALGREPSTEIVRLEPLSADERGALELPFDDDEAVLRIERLRRVDGQRAGLVRTFLLAAAAPRLSPELFTPTGRGQSLPYVLEHHCGVVLGKGEETTAPVTVPPEVADHLGCEPEAVALLKVCVLEDATGRKVLYEEAYWAVAQTRLVQRYPAPRKRS